MSARSIETASILCECGAYHPAIETDGLVVFGQTQTQREAGDPPCDVRAQFALSDDEVSDLAADDEVQS